MATEEDLITARGHAIPGAALSWWATRSGGPGGQHANTSDTHVTIELNIAAAELPETVTQCLQATHGATVRAMSADSRSQFRNRQLARKRLADLIDDASRPVVPRRPTRPGRGAVRRRLDDKKQQSEKKQARAWRPDRNG